MIKCPCCGEEIHEKASICWSCRRRVKGRVMCWVITAVFIVSVIWFFAAYHKKIYKSGPRIKAFFLDLKANLLSTGDLLNMMCKNISSARTSHARLDYVTGKMKKG